MFPTVFQRSLIALMFQDTSFRDMASAIITPPLFDGKIEAKIAGILINFSKTYPGVVITQAVVVNEVKKLGAKKEIDKADLPGVLDIIKLFGVAIASEPYIRKEFQSFATHKILETEIINSVDLLKKGQYDEIVRRINAAQSKTSACVDHEEFYMIGGIEDRIAEYEAGTAFSEGVSTSVRELDNMLFSRGVAPKEMIVFCGAAGRGKSILLGNIGLRAVHTGEVVLYYTLEVDRQIVMARSDPAITGIAFDKLAMDFLKAKDQWDILRRVPPTGELILLDKLPMTLKPSHIRADLHRINEARVKMGLKPVSVVIIDYADIQASDRKNDDKRLDTGDIYVDDRSIAKEFGVSVFTASQANRANLWKKNVDLDALSEDFSKAFTADYVVGMSQTKEELVMRDSTGRGTGVQRLYVGKNRNGPKAGCATLMTDLARSRYSMGDWDEWDKGVYGCLTCHL